MKQLQERNAQLEAEVKNIKLEKDKSLVIIKEEQTKAIHEKEAISKYIQKNV